MGRNLRGDRLRPVLDLLLAYPAISHFEVERRADIDGAAAELLDAGVDVLVVNGGDGTVQAVLTCLFGAPRGAPPPVLAVLPGGTTNMTAGNVGIDRHPARALRCLLESARSGRLGGEVVRWPVMRVEHKPGAKPIFGMYFGAGAIYQGINLCRRRIHTLGARGETGPGITLAIVIGRILFGPRGTLVPPVRVEGRLGEEEIEPAEYLGFQVTTLDHLFLGMRPYWGGGAGSLRYTAVRYSPQHPFRVVLPIMRGKPNRYVRREFGYFSRRASEVVLRFDGGFSLEGEIYATEPGYPVTLRDGYEASFLRYRDG